MPNVLIAPSLATQQRFKAMLGGGRRGPWAKALQAAVSRTVTTGAALMARGIGAHLNMRIGDIKSLISISRGSWDKPAGKIILKRKSTPMIYYITGGQRAALIKHLRSGLWSKLRKAGGLKIKPRKLQSGGYGPVQTLTHAFIAVMRSGHMAVFKRAGKARVPIEEVYGPTALGIYLNAVGVAGGETLRVETEEAMAAALEKNVRSQLSRFVNGKGA